MKNFTPSLNLSHMAMNILAVIACAFVLIYTKSIMVPFVISCFAYLTLLPVLLHLHKQFKFPKTLALSCTFFLAVIILWLGLFFVGWTFRDIFTALSEYQENLVAVFNKIQNQLIERGLPIQPVEPLEAYKKLPLANMLSGAGFGVLHIFSTSSLVLIFLLFLLMGTNFQIQSKSSLLMEVDQKIRRYLFLKFMISVVTAIVVYVSFKLIGLGYAHCFAILAFFLNFIPTVGSIIATLLPLPMALIQFDSLTPILLVLLVPGSFQIFMGSLVEPKLFGQKLKLHPIVILISLMFWSLIWGLAGAFLAVPLTAIIKIILERIEGGKVFSELLAGNLEAFND